MAVTRKDVAKMANVSVATVSYVINNTKNVTPEVRKRVLDAVDALNYHPNLLAKSLATRETRHVAMLVDNIQNPHYGRLMRGVQHAAEQEGYIVSVLSINYSTREAMRELVSRGVDGVILALGGYSIRDFSDMNLPTVYETATLQTSYRKAIFDMVHLFRDLGHRRIAFLSGLPLTERPHVRFRDFMDALQSFRIEMCPELFIDGDGATDEAAGYEAADRLLNCGSEFTAVFTVNDLMAIGALKRLWEAGLKVPADVSVVGCDGISSSAYTIPPLSTIQSHSFKLGEALMLQLISQIHPERELAMPVQIIEAKFVERESVGPARKLSGVPRFLQQPHSPNQTG